MNTAIDLTLIAILLICGWSGYKKGLIMGIGGIVVFAIAVYGANLLSNTYSYEAIDALRPFAGGYVEKKIDEEVRPVLGLGAKDISVEDYLKANPEKEDLFCTSIFEAVGIYSQAAEKMSAEAQEYADTQNTSLKSAVIEVLCMRAAYVCGFILAFLLIHILLTVIGNLPNISYKLPDMDLVNDIGGASLGVFNGFLFCVTVVWALKFTGMLLSQKILSETLFASDLMRWDLLGDILGI
jgi:hypothetical protein